MDWLTFISSMTGALVWPVVIIVLLILLRQQLGSLAARIIKLTLPGGVEASFGKELEESREAAEKIVKKATVVETEGSGPRE